MSARQRAIKAAKYADGGAVPATQFPGKAVMEEAKAPAHGFKRGGIPKKKKGGMAEGAACAPRLDKMPRRSTGGGLGGLSAASKITPAPTNVQKKADGGAVSMRGRSPYSSASKVTQASVSEDD